MSKSNGFPTALADARRRTTFSQSALSIEAGLDASFVSRMERGERHPLPATVLALAKALSLAPLATARLMHSAGYWSSDPLATAMIVLAEVLESHRLSASQRLMIDAVQALLVELQSENRKA